MVVVVVVGRLYFGTSFLHPEVYLQHCRACSIRQSASLPVKSDVLSCIVMSVEISGVRS